MLFHVVPTPYFAKFMRSPAGSELHIFHVQQVIQAKRWRRNDPFDILETLTVSFYLLMSVRQLPEDVQAAPVATLSNLMDTSSDILKGKSSRITVKPNVREMETHESCNADGEHVEMRKRRLAGTARCMTIIYCPAVKSQNVHVRKTGSRAQNQDFICLKVFKPTPCGSHAPISGNAVLPMGAGEATTVLRSTYGASSCDKILKYIPHGPPVKPLSAGAYGPDDTRDPHEKGVQARHQGGVATNASCDGALQLFLPAHRVHGPSTELGPVGSSPVFTRLSPLGPDPHPAHAKTCALVPETA
ncbi:hypothetical protein C8J57DRAFT_1214085 [Mycena rebaudengoi]|nr:hypothetical protein C8J57DRAFT_1214085 [Mycena rebaudengoi]